MFLGRCSLNPLATSFIPRKKSQALREMAVKSIAELWEKKKTNGEGTFTNEEIARLVGNLISMGYKDLTISEKIRINNYLNKKFLSSKVPIVRPVADLARITTKLRLKYIQKEYLNQAPTALLIAFWGLYRHEQSMRPLLSLTYRPDILKNSTWSVNASDMKLWNKSCVSEACECPPAFGYSIPSNFFGELPHLQYMCPVQNIHLNHYSDSIDGNELILMDNLQHNLVDEQPFKDIIYVNNNHDVNVLKDHFKTTISGICNMLAKFADDFDYETEDNEVINEIDYYNSLWDDDNSNITHVPFNEQNRESLVDDNDHPLLEISNVYIEEDVPPEVEEMIRKSLSSETDSIEDLDEERNLICNSPCSVWCDSVTDQKLKILEDAPTFDLVPLKQVNSKELQPVNLTLKPTLNFSKSRSVSDSNPSYSKTKFDFMGVTAPVSNLMAPKDAFAFLQKNPISLVGSWTGSDAYEDSGFSSGSSSEDVFFGRCEKESIWKHVTSKDSLWKPLPECIDTNYFSLNRVSNFRRQQSAS